MMTFAWYLAYKSLTFMVLLVWGLFSPILRLWNPGHMRWYFRRLLPEPLDFQPDLWLHAVSVGELNVAGSLLKAMPAEFRSRVLITTTTHSGHQYALDVYGPQNIRLLPWDFHFCFRRLFKGKRTPGLVVVETEIWPGLYRFVHGRGAAIVIVNGRISAKTLRMVRNPLWRHTLSLTSRVVARGTLDRERFQAFGLREERLAVSGNMKFDFEPKILAEGPFRDWLARPEPLMIFASISADEAPLLAPRLKSLFKVIPGLRVLWAPRHLDTVDKHLEVLAAFDPKKRSQTPDESDQVVVLDTFGELSGCYPFAELSLIGGSFNQRGGQNFLESLQAGTPAMIGPSHENFRREVTEALAADCIVVVGSPRRFVTRAIELLQNDAERGAMAERGKQFLMRHKGAIARTYGELLDLGLLNGALPNPQETEN